ncbi:type I-E CRISPR-associated protein Cse1/CasA [Crossiella sp. CA-258035]|uniref:type I-E CRISPR-associated protein Cse1/CasA n=1 Tax=Crossiella sp. CA-258035 TaxID=2981138 RepID=UPI0024BBFA08|nr:type I-E CRISPR-associated protein Cse1/CasA [Crossiella sp. CA-258035]WHT17413.1 type I-E CRISPR-associated protein Cse1/CasA [Crossiella sp. CA-258035]
MGEERDLDMVPGRPAFDLLEREWIPVRRGTSVSWVGLRELFTQAHDIDDLAVSIPPAAAALWRVLHALAARITGLAPSDPAEHPSTDDWLNRRFHLLDPAEAGSGRFAPEAIESYFAQHAEAFDLFGPRPWMQEPALAQQCPAPSGINKLVFGRPTGNNQVWFGHFTDQRPEPIRTRDAVLHLLIQHYYGPAGKCTARTVNGARFSNSTKGILRSTLSYHPLGNTLFESLLAGLPAPVGNPEQELDLCPWERAEPADPLGLPPRPSWPGGLLTGRSRHAVLLCPDATGEHVVDAYVTWAWRQPAAEVPDPYLIYQLSKDNNLYGRPAKVERSLWRDLDALLRSTSTSSAQPQRPTAFATLAELPEEVRARLRVRAYGFDQDGQTREKRWFSSVTPPVLNWLEKNNPRIPHQIGLLRERAEAVGTRLEAVLARAWQQVLDTTDRKKRGPWPERAAQFYWPAAEEEFWARLRAEKIETSATAFRALAHRAINSVLSEAEGTKPAVVKALAAARRNFDNPQWGKENR